MNAPGEVDLTAGVDVVEVATLYSATQRGRFTVAEVAQIDARVTYGELPWWRRLVTRTPPGWRR